MCDMVVSESHTGPAPGFYHTTHTLPRSLSLSLSVSPSFSLSLSLSLSLFFSRRSGSPFVRTLTTALNRPTAHSSVQHTRAVCVQFHTVPLCCIVHHAARYDSVDMWCVLSWFLINGHVHVHLEAARGRTRTRACANSAVVNQDATWNTCVCESVEGGVCGHGVECVEIRVVFSRRLGVVRDPPLAAR